MRLRTHPGIYSYAKGLISGSAMGGMMVNGWGRRGEWRDVAGRMLRKERHAIMLPAMAKRF